MTQSLFFPPCPYCKEPVTGVQMVGDHNELDIYSFDSSVKVPMASYSYWLLEPCNHKVLQGDYTVTVQMHTGMLAPAVSEVGTVWVTPDGAVQVRTEDGWMMLKPPSKKVPGVYIESAVPGGPAWTYHSHPKEVVGGHTVVGGLSEWLPGLVEHVNCPVKAAYVCSPCRLNSMVCAHGQDEPFRNSTCPYSNRVQDVIVHLNDNHRWRREQIADWLETLDVDLTFPTEKPVRKNLPYADRSDKLVIIGPTIAAIQREAARRQRGRHEIVEVLADDRGWQRLRGYHRLQYTVVSGAAVGPELEALLKAYEFREVGEESPGWEGASAAKIVQDIYAAKVQQMLQYDVLLFGQPKQGGKSLHQSGPALDFVIKDVASHLSYDTLKASMDKLAEQYIVPAASSHPVCTGPDCSLCALIGVATQPITEAEVEAAKNPVEKALDHKASQATHWAKFSKPTNPLKSKKKGH